MNHIKAKLAVAGTILSLTVAYLAFAGVRSGWVYYLDVDAFLAGRQYQSQRVRLCGRVADEGMTSEPAALIARFDLLGKSQQLAVVYHGVVPDTFKPGVDLVLEGKLNGDGVFEADVMMTKCASKYQAEEHAKRLEVTP